MSFYEQVKQYENFQFKQYCSTIDSKKVCSVLQKDCLTPFDFLALLSEAASSHLEQLACRARDITRRNFGNVIFLFTPLYVSNICENHCSYCSFASKNSITRRHLGIDEITAEAKRISSMGIRHILLLTGEAKNVADLQYLKNCVSVLNQFFSSVSIEVYPLGAQEYKELIDAGVDGLTIYQETYNEQLYARLHRGGPKENYLYRLDAAQRACSMSIRSVTVGPLMGLGEPVADVFFAALHAAYIQREYPSVEVSISFPRIRPLIGAFSPDYSVSDRQFVQFITAVRIFLNTVGITVSTRESAQFRNALITMGPTKLSAGVSTAVGGHTSEHSDPQFQIADCRSVEQVKKDLSVLGFQPVMHDWNSRYTRM